MVWFASTDNHQGLFDWFLCFPPETVRWFGELRDYELQTIAEFVASFFADRFQIIYELSSDSENFYIHFVGNTVRLDTSHEDMKGFVHIWLNHLHSLFGFLVCEYGMVFEMADIFRRYPMCYQKIDLREKWN